MNSWKVKWLIALALNVQILSSYAVTLNAFVEDAVQQSIFQTESAKVALTKSSSSEVKDFANNMVSENSHLYLELQKLAQQLHMDVPTEPSLASKAKLMRLEYRDESFDRIYIDGQVETLEQRMTLFKKEATSSENSDLKAFAKEALPGILKQVGLAKNIQTKLKPSAGALTPVEP
ncbi:lipoprotein [Pseudomonas fluorescens]|uniref:Lipoprotein n=1 Tax=Pseudomonas fluorescens TaxID=294 RepID=A0A3S4PVY0_PSEFL|nr:DUF4142 domain-containing protein [Pseudomonas fluorescens]VEF11933.1 lipoprotein [Pseudomonas fluorescens]